MDNDTLEKLTLSEKASLLTGGTYWTSAEIKEAEIPSVRFSDGPTGLRPQGDKGDYLGKNKSYPATCFPTHSALACSWNSEILYGAGRRIGEEAGFYGADVLLAPDINVKRNPLCGRNFEYLSEDPYMNGVLGAAYAEGVQSAGTGACLKHFAANNREFARTVCDSVADERTLREIYLTGFEIAVKRAKPAAAMSAYNRLNGEFCNESRRLLTDILRREWGFDGIVVSDWGGTADRVRGVKAGADLEMPPCKFSAQELVSAVGSGALEESELDGCARRIIKLANRPKIKTECDFNEHAEYARRCAEECAVLLKNDGALPLDGGKIALVGYTAANPLIQGGGSSKVNPKGLISLADCLKDKVTGYAQGYKISGAGKKLKRRALKLCKSADTVIFCMGLFSDAEGADRADMLVPQNQIDLLKEIKKLNKKVVAVLFCGCAVDTSWDKYADALLFAGLSGQAGAAAVADILFGKVNPSGKLAETFPENYDDLPCAQTFGKDPYAEIYGEGMRVGYRSGVKAKYPFGYGLSYTSFEYGNLHIDGNGAGFDITNAGNCYGGECAQLYINFPEQANCPRLQLKGFKKVFLAAGETARININFDEYSFRSFDTSAGEWTEVAGEYGILIGSSSEDIRLSGSVVRAGKCESVAPSDTSSLKAQPYPLERDKKGRVIADMRTPFCELKKCKSLAGRLFVRAALRAMSGDPTRYGSLQYLPLRTLAQFAHMNKRRLEGLINVFNGKFLRGIFKLIRG